MNTGKADPTKLSVGRKELLQYLRFREVYIFKKKFGYQEAFFYL